MDTVQISSLDYGFSYFEAPIPRDVIRRAIGAFKNLAGCYENRLPSVTSHEGPCGLCVAIRQVVEENTSVDLYKVLLWGVHMLRPQFLDVRDSPYWWDRGNFPEAWDERALACALIATILEDIISGNEAKIR